jgi:hypothetical protein
MDDVDFKAKVTRVEFEELCADLFERVPGPVQQALQSAEMSLVSELGRHGCWEGMGQDTSCREKGKRSLLRKAMNCLNLPSPFSPPAG